MTRTFWGGGGGGTQANPQQPLALPSPGAAGGLDRPRSALDPGRVAGGSDLAAWPKGGHAAGRPCWLGVGDQSGAARG